MEESNDLEASTPPPQPSSLTGRLMNVFAAPGEAFDAIKSNKIDHANWYVPLILSCLVAVLYIVVMFSQPNTIQDIIEQQEANLQKQVDAGTMTQEQMDQRMKTVEDFMKPGFLMISGSFGAITFSAIFFFAVAFGIWLLGRFVFKPQFLYFKALEVVGLASMISVLGAIVSALLMVVTGQMQATLGPALLISDFNPANKTHAMLAALNVFSLWYIAILSLGLAKISGHAFAKAAVWLYAIWAVVKFGGIWLMPS